MMINWELKHQIIERFRRQADFAAKVGRTQSAISEVIHGRKQISPKEERRWAKALSCKPEQLFPVRWQALKDRAKKEAR
jgi:plasmid maintenance system antidote protein VapI